MARIPEAEIEHLKRGVSVAKLAEAHGVKLRQHGADLLGLCPFHADRTPSLVIAPAKNLWHCLGACGTGGSAIDWVMRVEGVSFRHAVEKLRAEFPSFAAASSASTPTPSAARPAPLTPLAAHEAGDEELLERVVAHYEATLETSAGGAGVSRRAQDREPRGAERLSSWFFEPHAGLPDAGGSVGEDDCGA
jgi:DNA primase